MRKSVATVVAGCLLTIITRAPAATVTVTTALDSGADAAIGASLAADQADGGGLSLREAINWAAAGDTVSFNSGMSGATIQLSANLAVINKALTIVGLGSGSLAVDANLSYTMFDVGNNSSVALQGLTLRGQSQTGSGLFALRVASGSTAAITDVVITDNTSRGRALDISGVLIASNCVIARCTNVWDNGGAMILNSAGVASFIDCAFRSNAHYRAGQSKAGGAIYCNGGSLALTNCLFVANSVGPETGCNGGAIHFVGSAAQQRVVNTTFLNNQASGTAALYLENANTVVISNCVFRGNSAGVNGAGMYITSTATLFLVDSTFVSNRAASASGCGGGLYLSAVGPLTFQRCTFATNHAGADGGGVYQSDNTAVSILNATFSGNTANDEGGGLYFYRPTTLVNCTFTANHADNDDSSAGTGGAIGCRSGVGDVATLHNTLAVGNYRGSGSGTASDLANNQYNPGTSSYNLIGSGGNLVNGADGNQVGVVLGAVGLGALVNNGGLTQTHAISTDSIAKDSGSDAQATGAGLTVDQRGLARIVGTAVDVGAYELAPLGNQGTIFIIR